MNAKEILRRARAWHKKAAVVLGTAAPVRWGKLRSSQALWSVGLIPSGGGKTADWRSEFKRISTGQWWNHRIRISPLCGETCAKDIAESPAKFTRYIRELMRHELAHAAFTELQVDKLAAVCAAEKVNFQLFNLFEDLRIEAAWVSSLKGKDFGEEFAWEKFMPGMGAWESELATEAGRVKHAAGALWAVGRGFYTLKKGRNTLQQALRKLGVNNGPASTYAYTIFQYANSARAAADSWESIKLAAQFQREFPNAVEPARPEGGFPGPGSGPIGEPGAGAEAAADAGREAAADAPAPAPTPGPGPSPEPAPEPGPETKPGEAPAPETVGPQIKVSSTRESASGALSREEKAFFRHFKRAHEGPGRLEDVPAIKARIRAIAAAAGFASARIAQSGRRLHVPGIVGGGVNCFRGVCPAPGRPRITLILDLSASMRFAYAFHAAPFAIALHQLAAEGAIEFRVWASGTSSCETGYSIDITRGGIEAIKSLGACGNSENLAATLRRARADIEWATLAIVYTDGNITDAKPDRVEETAIGVVVSQPGKETHHAGNLKRHFARVRVADTASELAREIARAAVGRRQ